MTYTNCRNELVEAVDGSDPSRSGGNARGLEMCLIRKTRRARRFRKKMKADSSESQPAVSIVCGQRAALGGRERKLNSSFVERCKSP